MNKSLFWSASVILLSSCTLEPKFDAPDVSLTAEWKNRELQIEQEPLQYEHWWDIFNDSNLKDLINDAIENNQDLLVAQARLEQARNISKIAFSKLFPKLTAPLSYSNQEELTQLYGPLLPNYPFVIRELQKEYALPFTLTYEADVWGKVRSSYKSAKLATEAKEKAYEAAKLFVTTELANAYFQIRILDAQTEIYERLIEIRREELEIYRARYEGNLINYIDVAASIQELDFIKSMYCEVKQKRAVFENTVAVLLGKTPSSYRIEPAPLTNLPPTIPSGVPCSVLLRRPDLAEQERHLRSIHALLGVAYAAYFPSLDLESAGGWISPLSKFFFKGLSNFWMIGATLTELIFDAGARYYQVQLTWSQFQEAEAAYRQGVLTAFQEVENALSNLNWIDRQMTEIDQAIQASTLNALLANDRYDYGVSSYLPVTEKLRQELDNKALYLTLLGFRYMNTLQLIKALGGGW